VIVLEGNYFLTVLVTVFLAEIGDKTQSATMLFATNSEVSLLTVFLAASLALVLASGVGVLAGAAIGTYVDPKYLSYAAGIGFIAIGCWTLYGA